MFKPFILLSVSFFIAGANAQKIYYAKTEGNFLYIQSHIIGQVKDHILIWKFETSKPGRSQILIYDARMNILDRVRTGILDFQDKFSVDFINMGESFSVVYQYKTKTTSFCKIASFDENGHRFKMQTIDSVPLNQPRLASNNYTVVRSVSQKNFALIKTLNAKNGDALNLQYHLLDNAGAPIHSASVLLPVKDLQVNELLLDSGNNLVIPVSKNLEKCSLVVYKVTLETGRVLSTNCEITNGSLASNTISISEAGKNYFITAQWKSAADSVNYSHETGLFFWRLDTDLSDASNDTIFAGAAVPRQFFNSETFFKGSSILQNDAVYIICAPSYIASVSNYMSGAPAHMPPTSPALNETFSYSAPNSGTHTFYDDHLSSPSPHIKAGNGVYVLNNMDPDDKLPTLRSANRSYLRRNTLVTENFQFIPASDMRLFILRADTSNRILWTKYFDGTSMEGVTSFVNLAKILTVNGALTLLYAMSGKNEKQIFEKIQFARDSGFNKQLVFSMDLKYTVIFQKGVAINSSAVVFPCLIKDKLAFAKVETE